MISSKIVSSTFSSIFSSNFSTISRSLHLEKLKGISPSLKAKSFTFRHIGPTEKDSQSMLSELGMSSLKELMQKAVPTNILHNQKVEKSQSKQLGESASEGTTLAYLQSIADKNELYKNYIGLGFNPTILPSCILMNVFMNPNWLTSYTPYQSEISQGRLEALLNFQTMISELTGLDLANSSLLDEGSAAAEAMYMAWNISNFTKKKFFISSNLFPYIKQAIKTKAHFLGLEIVEGDWEKIDFDNTFCGGIVQNPDNFGRVKDLSAFSEKMKKAGGVSIIDCDIASLLLVKSPKDMGFDIALGSTQRFGIPLMNGGPHCGYFACSNQYKRKMPGRIVGISKDAEGNIGYRLALQTREQHIRRNMATSNICTAQALIANISGFYAIFHGKKGLIEISERINRFANYLAQKLNSIGIKVISEEGKIFGTVMVDFENKDEVDSLIEKFRMRKINIRKFDNSNQVAIALNETTTLGDLEEIIKIFYEMKDLNPKCYNIEKEIKDIETVPLIDDSLKRDTSNILNQEIFNKYTSEHQMVRYIKTLEAKDISLTNSMIPLGSCTLKLNAANELLPIFWNKFTDIHPFAPLSQKEGYSKMIKETEDMLKSVTQFDGVSFQPNSGATGEYSGLLVIRRYQESKGEGYKDICLIPNSAHGTNFASAALCGLKVVVVDTDKNGNISLSDLKKKLEQYKDRFSCMMITYPSTHGVYEKDIKQMCDLVHQYGGQLYMDGANMNAQVCVTSPGFIGADVCHLNLHKTFALPHGGGGPGIGPICVKKHLTKFLPGKSSPWQITAGPYGSIGILPIAFMYLKMLGKDLTLSTQVSVLNSNYLMNKLEKHYPIVYKGLNGLCAHEFMIDIDKLKHRSGISEEDIAKRLMDYGFHAPTMSFPVHGTLMIEPTESEDKEELDYFAESLINIRKEIQEVIDGKMDKNDNVLKNAPHTQECIARSNWNHKYSREKAAFPLGFKRRKVWPTTRRINNVYGDLHLVTKCLH